MLGVLLGLVVLSAALRIRLAAPFPAPFAFFDEVVYSELAKGLAETGELQLRGERVQGFAVAYPLLLSVAYRLHDDTTQVYATGKVLGAVVMSLAAVPAYLLARRLLGRKRACLVALLAVALPSMFYSSALLTENLFYPTFLLASLACVGVLTRPTPVRQLVAVLGMGAVNLVHHHAFAVPVALGGSIVVLGWLRSRAERRGLRGWWHEVRVYWITGAALLLAVVARVGGLAARGGEAKELLGRYAYFAERFENFAPGEVARLCLVHLGELTLFSGVVPIAALCYLAVRALRRRPVGSETVFVVFTGLLVVCLVVQASAFVQVLQLTTIKERNLFFVAPALAALVLHVPAEGFSRIGRGLAAVAAGCLPFAIPYERYLNSDATMDTLALAALWRMDPSGEGPLTAARVAGALSIGLAVAFLLARGRLGGPLLLVPVLGAMVAAQVPLYRYGLQLSRGGFEEGVGGTPGWIDAALPEGATADALWMNTAIPQTIWLNEFFDRKVGRLAFLDHEFDDFLPQVPLTLEPETGLLREADGEPFVVEYALVPHSTVVEGEVVAVNEGSGSRLVRVDGPLRLVEHFEGRWPDGWARDEFSYLRTGCEPGTLYFALDSPPDLREGPRKIEVRLDGELLHRITLPATSTYVRPAVPIAPGTGSVRVTFSATPLSAERLAAAGIERPLGIFLQSVVFEPE